MNFSQDTILTIGLVVYGALIVAGYALNATTHRDWLLPALKWLGGPLGWLLAIIVLGAGAAYGFLQEWLVVAILWATWPTVMRWLLNSAAQNACVDVPDDAPARPRKKSRRT